MRIHQRRAGAGKASALFTAVVLAALAALAGCARHEALPPETAAAAQEPFGVRAAESIVRTGRFTEYTLPAGADPISLANGLNNTVWFPTCDGTASISQLSASSGLVTTYKPSVVESEGACSVVSAGGYFWYSVWNGSESLTELARVTSTGAIGIIATNIASTYSASGMTAGWDGRLWLSLRAFAGRCGIKSGTPGIVESFVASGAVSTVTHFPNAWTCAASAGCFCFGYYEPVALAQASDKNIYAAAYFAGGYNGYSGSAVIRITPAASTLPKFALPTGAGTVSGWLGLTPMLPIAGGPDGKMWIGESGLNQIASMTTAGVFSQFKIPTATSGISAITPVPGTVDAASALWFTESSANKIARISVSGSVTEIPVPAPSARPTGIIPCSTAVCGAHGGVWFAEPGAKKIARYDFP